MLNLHPPLPWRPVPSRRHGLDADEFDAYCDHLLVRECSDGTVIGTCRVLTPQQARAAGGLHADRQFDLEPLRPLRANLAEVGRTCVDARHGGVVLALWRALPRGCGRSGRRSSRGAGSVKWRHRSVKKTS